MLNDLLQKEIINKRENFSRDMITIRKDQMNMLKILTVKFMVRDKR